MVPACLAACADSRPCCTGQLGGVSKRRPPRTKRCARIRPERKRRPDLTDETVSNLGVLCPGFVAVSRGYDALAVVLEVVGAEGTTEAHEVGAGGRPPDGHTVATLGLGLEDGKAILAAVQRRLVAAQVKEHVYAPETNSLTEATGVSAWKKGSDSLSVQFGPSRPDWCDEAGAEQIETGPAVHLPFHELEFGDRAFGLAVRPWLGERSQRGRP
jgi:hypothetical protein